MEIITCEKSYQISSRIYLAGEKGMAAISVIVPVYNVEKYINRCIDSILSQTFSDFELILVDDGSPDKSGDICDAYIEKDHRVRVIHQRNAGQSAARNNAVAIAQGEWICFVDSDDCIHPQLLEHLFEAVTKIDANISMCGAVVQKKLPENFNEFIENEFIEINVDDNSLHNIYAELGTKYWVIWGKLIKTDIVRNFPMQNGRVHEDNAIAFRWLCEAGKVANLSSDLYFYCTEPESTTRGNHSLMRFFDYLWALETQMEYYSDSNFQKMATSIAHLYVYEMAERVNLILKNREKAAYRKLKNQAKNFINTYSIYIDKKKEKINLFKIFHPKLLDFYWTLMGIKYKLFKGAKKNGNS